MTKEEFEKNFPHLYKENREIRCSYNEDYACYVLQLFENDVFINEIKFYGVSTMQETIRHWLTERKERRFEDE